VQRFGDDEAGFSVDVDTTARAVKIDGWGFWDPKVAAAFDSIVIEVCRGAPRGSDVSIDMGRLKPMRDEGQSAVAHVVSTLAQLKVGTIAFTTTSHLTKLQLMRIVRDAAPKDRVSFT